NDEQTLIKEQNHVSECHVSAELRSGHAPFSNSGLTLPAACHQSRSPFQLHCIHVSQSHNHTHLFHSLLVAYLALFWGGWTPPKCFLSPPKNKKNIYFFNFEIVIFT